MLEKTSEEQGYYEGYYDGYHQAESDFNSDWQMNPERTIEESWEESEIKEFLEVPYPNGNDYILAECARPKGVF